MTRTEFNEEITTWYELEEVASDNGYEDLGDICDDENIRDMIQDRAQGIRGGDDWESFAYWVENIPKGYDCCAYFYDRDELEGLSDWAFDERKRKLCEWMEENCYFDPEDDDGIEDDIEPEPEEESVPEEDFTVGELVAMCYADVAVIAREEQEKADARQRQIASAC